MKKKKQQRIPANPICKECGFPIAKFQKYLLHNNGTVLCKSCYDKLNQEGVIE